MYQPAEYDNYGTVLEKPKYGSEKLTAEMGDVLAKLERFKELWPGIFTLSLFAIFGPSVISGCWLTQDPSVRYWIGYSGYYGLAVPVILVVQHLLHMWFKKPRFGVVLFSTVVPSLILAFIAYFHYAPLNDIADRLTSTDCITFPEKSVLEEHYKTAHGIFDTCVKRVAKNTQMTYEETMKKITIEDCSEYSNEVYKHQYSEHQRRAWDYIHELEVSQKCSGWCTDGDIALWRGSHESLDICSNTAGTVINSLVKRDSKRMLVSSLLCLFFSIGIMMFMQEIVIYYKLKW